MANLAGNGEGAESRQPRERPEWLERWLEYPQRAKQFLHETRVEMRQVTWPSQSEVISTTVVVLVTTLFFAAFLWLVDLGSQRLVAMVLKMLRH